MPMMKALVVYESLWGNTEHIAREVASGLSETIEVETVEVGDAPDDVGGDVALIVAGGPTHAFSMTRPNTRADALEQGATHTPDVIGLREWLGGLPTGHHDQLLATFDTRVAKARHFPGSAAKSAAKVGRRHGYTPAAPSMSFWVDDTPGPLLDGELDRAREWGRELAATLQRQAPMAR